jgi:hypothetical protein
MDLSNRSKAPPRIHQEPLQSPRCRSSVRLSHLLKRQVPQRLVQCAGRASGSFNHLPHRAPQSSRSEGVHAADALATQRGSGRRACGQANGFSLHAGVAAEANERRTLERLCRYVSRPAVAIERLPLTAQGHIRYALKTPYRDGTTHVVFEPLDFLSRLAALVPSPRVNLRRFHGVFAPHHRLRARIAPGQGARAQAGDGQGRKRAIDDGLGAATEAGLLDRRRAVRAARAWCESSPASRILKSSRGSCGTWGSAPPQPVSRCRALRRRGRGCSTETRRFIAGASPPPTWQARARAHP